MSDRPTCPTCGRLSGETDVVGDLAMFRALVENAGDLIVRADQARNRTYVSPSARDILGYEPSEMLGKHGYGLVHPDDLARVAAVFDKLGVDQGIQQVTFRMRRKDETYVWMEGRYRHLPEDGGILAIVRDVTAQKNADEKLSEINAQLEIANRTLQDLAHHDGLTGLINRRRFDEMLDVEFRRARRIVHPLGLVLLDLDCFKAYNDLYGHLAGDDCLRRVAKSIQGAVYRPGEQVARYGGEEIVALLPETDVSAAVIVADRMREAVELLGILHRGSPSGIVTISAGASSIVPVVTEDEPAQLVAAADRALYEAKSAGRNRVSPAEAHRTSWSQNVTARPQ